MKAPTKLVLIALFSVLAPLVTWAGTNDVLIVVNGNTEVNREAYNFVRKNFSYNKVNSNVTAALNPSSVKPGVYKTVVVLNTGVASGLDPVLKTFIDNYPDKKALYLVNLYKGKSDLTVTTFTAGSDGSNGVDGVTAASTWRQGFGSGQAVMDMHNAWVQDLVKFLGRT